MWKHSLKTKRISRHNPNVKPSLTLSYKLLCVAAFFPHIHRYKCLACRMVCSCVNKYFGLTAVLKGLSFSLPSSMIQSALLCLIKTVEINFETLAQTWIRWPVQRPPHANKNVFGIRRKYLYYVNADGRWRWHSLGEFRLLKMMKVRRESL